MRKGRDFGEALVAAGVLEAQTPEEARAEVADLLGLVGISEIAERAGVAINTVSTWLRRHDDFPKPVAELAQGKIWAWADVEPWIERQRSKPAGRPPKG